MPTVRPGARWEDCATANPREARLVSRSLVSLMSFASTTIDAAIAEGVGVARYLQSIDVRLGLSLSSSSSECTDAPKAWLLSCSRSPNRSQKISSAVVVSSVYAGSVVV